MIKLHGGPLILIIHHRYMCVFYGMTQCSDFPLMLSHRWLGDRRGIWSVKLGVG